jgi:glycosyltransferase involved in cell wall biosynthesis
LKITFVLPGVGLVGGIKVVFEYANNFIELGHEVKIIYPGEVKKLRWKGKIVESSKRLLYKIGMEETQKIQNWFELKASLHPAGSLKEEKYVPDADVIIGTWWETAHEVSKYRKEKGRKYYLIQHYEIWGGPKEKVDESYKLGLYNIVVSEWLRKKIEDLGAHVDAVIPIGVNFSEFYPVKELGENRSDEQIRILTPYRDLEWKGVEDACKAFEIASQYHDNLQFVMYGALPVTAAHAKYIPQNTEFHLNISTKKLNELYNSCDMFLYSSWHEGFALPPLEAMACKIPVISTKVGILHEFSSRDVLLYEPRDIAGLAKGITTLVEDKQKRSELGEKGYNEVQKFTWEKAARKLNACLTN